MTMRTKLELVAFVIQSGYREQTKKVKVQRAPSPAQELDESDGIGGNKAGTTESSDSP